jgi:ribosome-binding protein aMBF1 (putative translation factor)
MLNFVDLLAFPSKSMNPYFGEQLHDCLYLQHVNPKDKAYQRAYRAFRERLIRARTDAGMTQGQVNARLGKPHSFISKCELGERRVDFVELQTLAKIYGKSLSFFVTEN